MKFSPIDVFFLLLIIIPAIVCASKGFAKELLGKGAFILGIWIALIFYKKLVPYVEKGIHLHFLSVAIAFMLIFLVVFIIVMVIRQIVGAIFDGEIFKGLDRTLGFFLGLIEGIALVAIILIVISSQPWFNMDKLLGDSFFYKMLRWIVVSPVDTFQKGLNNV